LLRGRYTTLVASWNFYHAGVLVFWYQSPPRLCMEYLASLEPVESSSYIKVRTSSDTATAASWIPYAVIAAWYGIEALQSCRRSLVCLESRHIPQYIHERNKSFCLAAETELLPSLHIALVNSSLVYHTDALFSNTKRMEAASVYNNCFRVHIWYCQLPGSSIAMVRLYVASKASPH